MHATEYIYTADVIRVIDGDTLECRIDLGFGIHLLEHVRVRGINAPELRGQNRLAGQASRIHLIHLLNTTTTNGTVHLKSHKLRQDKYARYVFDVYANGINLGNRMVTDGFAHRADDR